MHTRWVLLVQANSASGTMPSGLSLIKSRSDLLAATLIESQYLIQHHTHTSKQVVGVSPKKREMRTTQRSDGGTVARKRGTQKASEQDGKKSLMETTQGETNFIKK